MSNPKWMSISQIEVHIPTGWMSISQMEASEGYPTPKCMSQMDPTFQMEIFDDRQCHRSRVCGNARTYRVCRRLDTCQFPRSPHFLRRNKRYVYRICSLTVALHVAFSPTQRQTMQLVDLAGAVNSSTWRPQVKYWLWNRRDND